MTDFSGTSLYQKLLPEVANVAYNNMELDEKTIGEEDFKKITQRICEDRKEDSIDFWVYLSDIEELEEDDDWSDVNGCIETMIENYLEERY